MTYPERVNCYNIEEMRKLLKNGPDVHPGANFLIQNKTKLKKFLRYGNRDEMAQGLQVSSEICLFIETTR